MDFARQQRDPARHAVGIAFVVLLHVVVIYALLTGLTQKAVHVIRRPLNATIIEEIKPPPPPPPPKKIIERPKVHEPVQTYVPPPDVPPPAPPPEPVISQVTPPPPPEPPVIAPPAPPPPPALQKPAVRRGIVPIEREDPVYPREAIRAGISKGRVVARVQIDEQGNVTDVIIVSADPPHVFDRAVKNALERWKFKGEGDKYVGEIEVNFALQD